MRAIQLIDAGSRTRSLSLLLSAMETSLRTRTALEIVSFPDPPPKRKGGSGEYSTSSHYGLAVAMDSAKAKPLKSLAGLQ